MADIKAQLKAKNGDNLYPVTSLAYVSAVSSGGIVINGNSIYTSAIPQANVYKLTTSLGAKQAKCSAGFRTYVSGATIGQNRYFDIAAPVSSGTLTVSAGSAYRIFATGNTVTVNAEGSASSAGVFGLEGHAAILLTNSSYLKFGTNVVLGAPLQIDAINNCTLRFHDGHCIIDVEDHEAAHAVTVATGTGTGSLYYWANWANTTSASAAPAYVSFSDALDGIACTFNGVTVNGDKHFVGNGKTLTVVTGTATASSKTYLTNMAISGATITGGTVYATDVLIPSGATTVISSPLIASNTLDIDGTLRTPGSLIPTNGLVVSGGHGMGNGGVLNLGGTFVSISFGGTAYISDCTVTGGSRTGVGGAFIMTKGNTLIVTSSIISGNTATSQGGALFMSSGCSARFENSVVSGNSVRDVYLYGGGQLDIIGGTFGAANNQGLITLNGHTTVKEIAGIGSTTIASGAILDLAGNTNATPISQGGGITFEPGGATVFYSSGAVAGSYMMDNVTLPAGAKLTNTGAVNLGGTNVGMIASGKTTIFDGVTITSGLSSGTNVTGGVFTASGTVIANSCTFTNCSATYGGAVATVKGTGARVTLNNCIMSANSTGYGTIFAQSGTLIINGGTYTGNIVTNGGGCAVITNGIVSATNAVISGNKASAAATAYVNDFRMNTAGGNLYLEGGCTVGLIACSAGTVTLKGSNTVTSVYGAGSVAISSGAILDLTGNTNATPINPGGGITYGANVTIINSAGTPVLLNNGTAGTCATIKKDGTTT